MIYLNIGRREQGKTTLAAYFAKESRSPLTVVFDPRALFPTVTRAMDTDQIADAFEDAYQTKGGTIVVTARKDLQAAFDQACKEIIEWIESGRGAVAFIVDEAAMYDTTTDDFGWLVRCIARADLTIIMTCHRPVDIPVGVRAIADFWCVFPVRQRHDFDALADRFSDQAMRDVRQLRDRQFVLWNEQRGTSEVYRDASAWFVSLGTPPARVAPLLSGGAVVDPPTLFDEPDKTR